MESDKLPSKAEVALQSADAVLSVSVEVEQELRLLIKNTAARQAAERRFRIEDAKRLSKKPKQEKPGWAEPLQRVIRARIEDLMKAEGFTDEDWTLKTSVAAGALRDIVERGKVGNGDVPADYRQFVAEYCQKRGHDPDATLRTLGLLWAGRFVGYSKPPTESELKPETMQFLAGLHYEFGDVATRHGKQETEGRARLGPKQIAARMQSKVPIIREAALDAFSDQLTPWVTRPPSGEDARKAHFADVLDVISVANQILDRDTHLDADEKRSLCMRMADAQGKIARKSGTI